MDDNVGQNIVDDDKNDIVNLPDIPLPGEVADEAVQDSFEAALRYCFIGVGAAGSRMAETFYNLGYRRVCVGNTAIQDLSSIHIPDELKLEIGVKGAGKDPVVGRRAAVDHAEDLLDLMERSFGPEFDRIIVCVGAGGGTGSGACEKVVEIARQLAQTLGIEKNKTRVGVLAALPRNSEGQRPAANTHQLLVRLLGMVTTGVISPLILVDNHRISSIYPRTPIDRFWDKANQSIASLFHLFNVIACKTSPYQVFDRADLEDVLDSGIITFGATPVIGSSDVVESTDKTIISQGVRDNLKKNVLCGGMDLSKGKTAACLFIGSQEILRQLPQDYLDYGFETLTRVLDRRSTIHRGIYLGDRPGLVVYTMLGGLGRPETRIRELALIGSLEDYDLGDGA